MKTRTLPGGWFPIEEEIIRGQNWLRKFIKNKKLILRVGAFQHFSCNADM